MRNKAGVLVSYLTSWNIMEHIVGFPKRFLKIGITVLWTCLFHCHNLLIICNCSFCLCVGILICLMQRSKLFKINHQVRERELSEFLISEDGTPLS